MKRLKLGIGAAVGILLTAPQIALMFLADQWIDLPFLPFDLFDWLTRVLPGPVITFGIDLMIDGMLALGVDVADNAKTAEQIASILLYLGGGVLAGVIFSGYLSARKIKPDTITGLVMGALYGLPMISIHLAIGDSSLSSGLRILWLSALFLVWGIVAARAHLRLASAEAPPDVAGEPVGAERISRRQFLITLGGASAVITVVGSGVGALLAGSKRRKLEQVLADSLVHQTETDAGVPFPNLNDPVMPAPGTRPEYTPIKDHYKVFIRTQPSTVDGSTWVLPITGLVDNPLMPDLETLKSQFQRRDQYVTLTCISGRVGTGLIGTTMWSCVSLKEVLAACAVRPEARYLNITSADGFHESVDLDLIAGDERIMLCYAWDGHDLPFDHGFPLRIWIPDLYGMKQPKWITAIEVTDVYKEGYWVSRNWDEIARVNTTSVIDTVALQALADDSDRKLVPVGGIAYAGARGISGVEVKVDDGPWQPAHLRAPLSETTWVIWRFDWPFEAGDHTLAVRCNEAVGTPQIEADQSPRPSGSTGIHTFDVDG